MNEKMKAARSAWIRGKSEAEIASALDLDVATIREWAFSEGWDELRDDAKCIAAEMAARNATEMGERGDRFIKAVQSCLAQALNKGPSVDGKGSVDRQWDLKSVATAARAVKDIAAVASELERDRRDRELRQRLADEDADRFG